MSIFDSLLPGYRSGVRVSRGPTKQQPIEQPHISRTRASTNTKLSEEQISGHTISKTCQSLTLRVSERIQAQEERTRSPHRDACRDLVEGPHCLRSSLWKTVGRPRPTSKLIASRGGVWKYAKHPDGPCTQMGVGISTKGEVRLHPGDLYHRPFYPAHVDASDLEFSNS